MVNIFLEFSTVLQWPIAQLLYLVSRTQANFPFPSVFGALPVHCYYTVKLMVPSVTATSGFLHLQVVTYLAAHSVLKPMSREQQELTAKALTGEGLDAPILIYGSSVSGAHKVHDSPEWFQSCLFCNKCRALPYHIFPGGVLAGTYSAKNMLLWEPGPAKKGDFIVLLPWKVFVCSCFHSALPSDAGTAHLDRCDPSVAQRDSS